MFSLLIAAMVNALDSLLYASLSVIVNAVTMVFYLFFVCVVGIQEEIMLHEKPLDDSHSVGFWVCFFLNI